MTTFLGSKRTWAIQLGVAAVFLTIAGCQSPFVKSTSPQPKLVTNAECAANCELAKTQCEQRQTQRENECKQSRQIASVGGKRCNPNTSKHCLEPVACLGADMAICRTEHSDCMRTCAEPAPAPTAPRMDAGEAAEPEQKAAPAPEAEKTEQQAPETAGKK